MNTVVRGLRKFLCRVTADVSIKSTVHLFLFKLFQILISEQIISDFCVGTERITAE